MTDDLRRALAGWLDGSVDDDTFVVAARQWLDAAARSEPHGPHEHGPLLWVQGDLGEQGWSWLPQHSAECAAQDDDADCICGVSDAYALGLRDGAATPRAEGLTGRAVHAAWRDGMLAQGREIAPERMSWETLPLIDRHLDEGIAAVLAATPPAEGLTADTLREKADRLHLWLIKPNPADVREYTMSDRYWDDLLAPEQPEWNPSESVRE